MILATGVEYTEQSVIYGFGGLVVCEISWMAKAPCWTVYIKLYENNVTVLLF